MNLKVPQKFSKKNILEHKPDWSDVPTSEGEGPEHMQWLIKADRNPSY